jgi:PAS domain S-box-containing protein
VPVDGDGVRPPVPMSLRPPEGDDTVGGGAAEEHPGGRVPGGGSRAASRTDVRDLLELLDAAFDAVVAWSFPDRRISFWSRGAERLYGYSEEEALGANRGELLGTGFPVPLADIERTVAERGRWEGELRQVSGDGRRLDVSARWAARRDPEGAVLDVIETNMVVPAGLTEQALRDSEQRFQILVEGVKDYAIFLLDTRGFISSWNEGAQRIKQYTAEEIIGQHFSIFYPPRDVADRKPWRELEVAAELGRFEEEGWRLRKDGRRFWANVLITALHRPDGRLYGFAKVTRDMTERRREQRRMEAMRRREVVKLREHADRMAQLEMAKTEFLRLASHELRGPMAVIRGYLSMLDQGSLGVLSTEAHRVVGILLAKSEEANDMVDQLLEAARMEDDRLRLRLEPTDMRRVVDMAVERMRPLLSDRHRVEVVLPEAPVVAGVDVERMRTVVSNLLDNARKYSPEGGLIRCALAEDRDLGRVVIEVSDQGMGIAGEVMPRLFSRFGRLVTPENSHIPGTGLGLYLSRELVRRHGGDITVTSQPGRGSTFRVVLPRTEVD